MLAALVTGAALAGARPTGRDDRPHLLLVPHTPAGRAALQGSDARVVARYAEFTLAEAAGRDDARLRQAGADRRDDMREVSLPDADLDPRSDRSSLAAKGSPDRAETLAVVQFVAPVKEAWFDRLEATGARVVQYAAENAYLVYARGEDVDRLAGLVGADGAVRAVAPVAADDKGGPVKATLTVTLTAGKRVLKLPTKIRLHPAAGWRRVKRHGLGVDGVCSRTCSIRARLLLDPRRARGLGLRAPNGPLVLAGRTARGSTKPSRIALRLNPRYAGAMLRARRLTPTLEAIVSGATGPAAIAAQRLTVRR